MATLDQNIDAMVATMRTYNAIATPSTAQQTAQIKALTQAVAYLIFARQNHPSDTP